MLQQRRAPLFEALKRHVAREYAGFHFPAHSGGRGLRGLGQVGDLLRLDLTELPGLDDLHAPAGPIARAQELAAALYGADQTFFLVNGSTAGIQALLLAATAPGEKVLLPRNVHRSVIGGLVLSGADPVYVPSPFNHDFGLHLPPRAVDVQAAFSVNPELRAVLWTHPDYYGLAALGPEVAVAVREAGLPLLVDEAHGAHLPFHSDMPAPALRLGAVAVVQSMHKMGGALTQASLLHLRGGAPAPERVRRALALLQTSSPSYLLMASLDLARRQLALAGPRLLERAMELAYRLRRGLAVLNGLEVLGAEAGTADPTKVVVSTLGLGLNGYRAAALLQREYRIQVEMAGCGHVLLVVGLGTRAPDIARVLRAFRDLAQKHRGEGWSAAEPAIKLLAAGAPLPEKVMTPRESWLQPSRAVPLVRAAGLVAAETVCLSPPGVPVVFPGEMLTPEVLEYTGALKALGLPVQAADPKLTVIRVHG